VWVIEVIKFGAIYQANDHLPKLFNCSTLPPLTLQQTDKLTVESAFTYLNTLIS